MKKRIVQNIKSRPRTMVTATTNMPRLQRQNMRSTKKQVRKQQETTKGVVVDELEQCIHSDEDPCVFNQIEWRLWKNGKIYFDSGDYEKAPITYNSSIGESVLTSTLPSCCVGVSTTANPTTGVWKTVSVLFSLPSMAKSWRLQGKLRNVRLLVMNYN
jgi:hypothetical protein